MLNVKNKWAFITGASRGIGYQIALFMAERGCNLVLHSRKISHLEKVVKEIEKHDIKYNLVECELSNVEEIKKTLQNIKEDIDIVFNNAAVQIAYRKNYFDTPVSDYIDSYYINTIAPMVICYHFLPKMINKKFGRIINTTSGIDKEPEQAGYSASKAALDKVTKDLASKIDGDVIISLVDPGWCRTDLGGSKAPNSVESALPGVVLGAFIDNYKTGRYIRAQEYAGMNLEEAMKKLG